MTGRHVAALAVLGLLVAAPWASAHPGVAAGTRCASCHADKTRGKSVHAALSITCMVCHMLAAQGVETNITLAVPKERICFNCHERADEEQHHTPKVKGTCVDCHDSHASPRRMLLLKPAASKKPH